MSDLLMYQIAKLPDSMDPLLQLRAQGDVPGAIEADVEHLLRTLAAFAPASASVALRFYYRPAGEGIRSSERLQMFLMGQSHTDSDVLRQFLEGGPFGRFYELEPIDECPIDWDPFTTACDIVRRQGVTPSTIPGELNARALGNYYALTAFEPRRDCDHLQLDGVLDGLDHPLLIEICVEPVDSVVVTQQHLAYIGTLQSVNRLWDGDNEIPTRSWFGRGESVGNPPLLRERDLPADTIVRNEQRNHESLQQPHLAFHIRVLAPRAETATLLASVMANSTLANGNYQLFTTTRNDPWFERLSLDRKTLRVVPLSVSECLLANWRDPRFRDLPLLGTMAPADQLISIFKPPHASFGTTRCIPSSTDSPPADERDSIILGHDVSFPWEKRLRGIESLPRGVVLRNLAKGTFISGAPGNGKTMLVFRLLMLLFAGGIPAIVLESGNKRDYRPLKCLKKCGDQMLRGLAKELQIHTPGCETVVPMHLNPLDILEGVSTNEWIENMVGCFSGAMPMFEPLPEILAQSLERVYDSCRGARLPPTMRDLYSTAILTLREKGYSSEVESNLRAAIETRLGGLTRRSAGRIFDCYHNMPTIDELMRGYSVVELASLTPERMSLLSLFLLTCINARIKTTSDPGKDVRLVIILEEAHNLVGHNHNTTGTSEEHADPKTHASDLVCRMLAEYRSLGVALVIVDQLASAVAPEVVKQTATKVSFRQADEEERHTITAAMSSSPLEAELIGRLVPGLCLFHTEGYHRPRLIRTRHLQKEFSIPPSPVGQAILPYLKDDKWFRKAIEARYRADVDRFEAELEILDDCRAGAFAGAKELLGKSGMLIQSHQSPRRSDFTPIVNVAHQLRVRLDKALGSFRSQFRHWLLDDCDSVAGNAALHARRRELLERFRSTVEPGTLGCLRILESLADGTHAIYSVCKGGNT